ncbi:bifunctional pyr operon transcriptional regulator/uracil phosphoribosyltransferase, partial [Planococcus sp. SIMBA_143]
MEQRGILDEAQISRSLTRMSHEILERNKGAEGIVFLGVRTRGEYLARRLQKKMEEIDGVKVPTGTIDITAFRDDRP